MGKINVCVIILLALLLVIFSFSEGRTQSSALYRAAVDYFQQGEYEKAKERLTRITSINESPESMLLLARCEFDPDLKRDILKRMLNKFPESAYADDASYELGTVYYLTDKFEESDDIFRKLASAPGDLQDDALYMRGLSLYRAGKKDAAEDVLKTFEKKCGSSPFLQDAFILSIRIKYDMEKDKECLEMVQDALVRFDPNDRTPAIYLLAVKAFTRIGNDAKAVEFFDFLKKNFPDSPEKEEASRFILGLSEKEEETTPVPSGRFTVQVAASQDSEKAERTAAQLQRLGYDSYIVQARIRGKVYFRVRVGHFARRVDADKLRVAIVGEGYSDAYVTTN